MINKYTDFDWTLNEAKITYKPMPVQWVLDNPTDVNEYFQQIWDKETMYFQESFYAIFLNQELKPLCWRKISVGNQNKVDINIKLLVTIALQCMSSNVVIAHNHPSDSIKPSKEDIRVTQKVIDLFNFFDIKLQDHLIITPSQKYYSFALKNML
jgi:DNA repair protein RadC